MSFLPLDSHIWVSASAGTGKTTALTGRVLQLLLHGVRPSSILCLTYTNAAAGEMKERIMHRLGTWVTLDEAALREELQRITGQSSAAMLQRARGLFFTLAEHAENLNIQTIHSFCQSVLRKFPIEAGISPYFSVMDDEKSKTLIDNAFHKLISNIQKPEHEKLRGHMQALFSTISYQSFYEFIQQAINESGLWQLWLDQPGGLQTCLHKLEEFLELPKLREQVNGLTNQRRQSLQDIVKICAAQKQKTYQDFASGIEQYLADEDAEAYQSCWLTNAYEPKKFIDKLAANFPEIAADLEAELQTVLAHVHLSAHEQSYALTSQLYHITEALFTIYHQLCAERSLLDYHQLLYKTQQFLDSEETSLGWVMFKLDGGIDHILVDEAQDTNPLQWQIIKALTLEYFSGEGREKPLRTIFIVGDEKQSIYSFQGANVQDYTKINSWLQQKSSAAQQAFHIKTLLTSYRSAKQIISAVSSMVEHTEIGEAHQSHQPWQGSVAFWPLVSADKTAGETQTEILARQLTEQIQSWLEQGRVLESTGQPVKPQDILVLVRKRGPLPTKMAQHLQNTHINVQGVERLMLKDHIAVQDVLALMQWVSLPTDDYSLACILRSPLADISEEELFELCYGRGEESLWQRLKASKHQQIIELLDWCLAHMASMPIDGFIYELLHKNGHLQAFRKRLGTEVSAIFELLQQKASTFEKEHPRAYSAFIEEILEQNHEVSLSSAAENAVRIMTIHGSKGLEAPIVILADTTQPLKTLASFEWLETDGLKLPCWLPGKAVRSSNLHTKIAQTEAFQKAEDIRLLYVAITRAKEELYIAGLERKSQQETWYDTLKLALKNIANEEKINEENQQSNLDSPRVRA